MFFSVYTGYGAGWTEDREKTFIVPPPKVIHFLLTLFFTVWRTVGVPVKYFLTLKKCQQMAP